MTTEIVHRVELARDAFDDALNGTLRALLRPESLPYSPDQCITLVHRSPQGAITLRVRITHVQRGTDRHVPAGSALLSVARLSVPELIALVRHHADAANAAAREAGVCANCMIWERHRYGTALMRDLLALVPASEPAGALVYRAALDGVLDLIECVEGCPSQCAPAPRAEDRREQRA